MKRTFGAVGLAALGLSWLATANAAAPDHLKCFKIRDPQARTPYTADLDVVSGTAGGVSETGCTIRVPAVMACVPTIKTNVTPTPPGIPDQGTPNSFFCYKAKCPPTAHPALPGTDQFGSRTVEAKTGSTLLCAPLEGPPTTTSTTATTTTTLRFVDNGDGTVADSQTNLIWEKKDFTCPGSHCYTDKFSWSASGTSADGTAFTTFLSALNGGATGVGDCETYENGSSATGGFAGHCDWRLPTIVELDTIHDFAQPNCALGTPCIDIVFGPTITDYYWSATTQPGVPTQAWEVPFGNAGDGGGVKSNLNYARAVRGGLRLACADGTPDGSETDVDCGGGCPACGDYKNCSNPSDCSSGYCRLATPAQYYPPHARLCIPTHCSDGVQDFYESDVDCGETCATGCSAGKMCNHNNVDCASGNCNGTICQ